MSNQKNNLDALEWRRDGLTISALNSGTSGPGSSPGWELCVVFLGKTVFRTRLRGLFPAMLLMGTDEFNAGG